ncbi:sulfatase-like hydrolase/transferase [Haloplanus litoreus]|uniref:Sulfatase-like hydrolase/transferase n=1 Tax=Haloplanus litoreus TaxID=767515 RepID=A0ABD6A225_9EURY
MTFRDWLGRTCSYIRSDGVQSGLRRSADEFKRGAATRIDPYVPGEPIFAHDWDVLIVLDACRPDLLAEVAESYDFLPRRPETVRSTGSSSWIWMERNFTTDWANEMRETAYVTGNPYSSDYVDPSAFALVDEVWNYAWDDDHGTVPARPITDRTIDTARTHDPERLLVHYMQPHFPSVPDPIGSAIDIDTFGEQWESIWDDLEAERISEERVWESYRTNLEYVLDDVALLLENVDAETVVITADHGNALGECGFYGHPPLNPHPSVRRVPWVETSARDTMGYEPSQEANRVDPSDGDVQSHLRDLGYL